ncbi:MAG: NUDIX domain-containing protein [Anaerolineae bacterium]|nr:NUDIX domain-containing protein [Anaerolineae bacterium]
MPDIYNQKDLEKWLVRNGIDTSQWGISGTKSVTNLWDELVNGDIQLLDDPPRRSVHVVEVKIRKGHYVLQELEQEFGNGERRVRNRLPSEKMKPSENCMIAAVRCLKEEIGVDEKDVSFIDPNCEQVRKLTNDSPSYPGLSTKYTFHTVTVEVDGLPDTETDFWRHNAAYAFGDPVKRHHWVWKLM